MFSKMLLLLLTVDMLHIHIGDQQSFKKLNFCKQFVSN